MRQIDLSKLRSDIYRVTFKNNLYEFCNHSYIAFEIDNFKKGYYNINFRVRTLSTRLFKYCCICNNDIFIFKFDILQQLCLNNE